MIKVSDQVVLSEKQNIWLLRTYLESTTDPILKELDQYTVDNYGFTLTELKQLNYSDCVNVKVIDEHKFLIFLIKSSE